MLIERLLLENRDFGKLKEKLLSLGWDEETVSKGIASFKNARDSRRRSMGSTCIGIAALLGLISCILGVANPIPELYYYFLYGITGVAILLGCYGLYNIFE